MKPTVAIIVLNWNGKDNTIECLKSINELQVTGYKLQVIVVDNGSHDGLAEAIEKSIKSIRSTKDIKSKLLVNNENLGYAGGNNVGIDYAMKNGAGYILILNNDTLVDENLIEELLKVTNNDSHVGIVAPKIYFAKGFEFHKNRYKESNRGKVIWYAGGIMDWQNVIASHRGVDEVDNGQYDSVEETDFASGCAMMIRRDVFEKLGLFDEKYFLYYEDSDFCQRAKSGRYKILYAPKAILWHKNAGSAGGSGSALQDYYITRNRMLFAMRYAPIRSKVAIVRESLHLIANSRPWQKRGVMDFYLSKFGKGRFNT